MTFRVREVYKEASALHPGSGELYSLMETGNWVSRDFYNGWSLASPNSAVSKGSVFNHS
jgi:hypothetical protein